MRWCSLILLACCVVLASCTKTRSYSLTMRSEASRGCYRDCRALQPVYRGECIAACPGARREDCRRSKKLRADAERVCVEVTTTDLVATARNLMFVTVVVLAVGFVVFVESFSLS